MTRLSEPELTVVRNKAPMVALDEERALAPARVGIASGSRHHPSFIQLYYAVEARRSNSAPLVVQFLSPTAHTGTSTVACGYARVAADDCAQPVLYIDCNPHVPNRRDKAPAPTAPTLFDTIRKGLPLRDAIVPARDGRNLLWARLANSDRPLLTVGGDRLQAILDQCRLHYPVVILDSPSADEAESAASSRYCDGTVLVVAAGRTRQWEIESAKALLERLGGQIVGLVLNRQSGG